MLKKSIVICICDEASEKECSNAKCLKHKKLQPTSCLNYPFWKRTDNTRPSITDFLKTS